MRIPSARSIVALLAALAFSSVAMAQTAQPQPASQAPSSNPWKYNGTDRIAGTGGPAPYHDLTGSWAGPRSGAGVPDGAAGAEKPSLTPYGEKLNGLRKPLGKYSPAGTNDPAVRTCDPFGFPRNATDEIRGVSFATMPSRVVVLTQFQQVYREIWMDGRQLPKNVGSDDKDAPDPRYYGYSVGHWEGDNTLVVDTTGLDENTWGALHTTNAHVQERYTRIDHNDLSLSIIIDDPKVYTKPYNMGTRYFKWIPNQMLDEKLCIPSEVLEYLQTMGDPAGSDPTAPPQNIPPSQAR